MMRFPDPDTEGYLLPTNQYIAHCDLCRVSEDISEVGRITPEFGELHVAHRNRMRIEHVQTYPEGYAEFLRTRPRTPSGRGPMFYGGARMTDLIAAREKQQ